MLKRKLLLFTLMIATVALFTSLAVVGHAAIDCSSCTDAQLEDGTCVYLQWGDGSGNLQPANWMVKVRYSYNDDTDICTWSYDFCPLTGAKDISHLNLLTPHDCDDNSFNASFYSETLPADRFYDGVGTAGELFGLGIIDHDAWKLEQEFKKNKAFTVTYEANNVDACKSNIDHMALIDAKLGFMRGDGRVLAQACPPPPCVPQLAGGQSAATFIGATLIDKYNPSVKHDICVEVKDPAACIANLYAVSCADWDDEMEPIGRSTAPIDVPIGTDHVVGYTGSLAGSALCDFGAIELNQGCYVVTIGGRPVAYVPSCCANNTCPEP